MADSITTIDTLELSLSGWAWSAAEEHKATMDKHSATLRATSYIVAMPEADKAIELIRSSIGRQADEITDLARVSDELLNALTLKSGDFRSIDEPPPPQQQPNTAAHAHAGNVAEPNPQQVSLL